MEFSINNPIFHILIPVLLAISMNSFIYLFGINKTFTFDLASILITSERFSFKRKAATSTGTWQWIAAVFSFILSS